MRNLWLLALKWLLDHQRDLETAAADRYAAMLKDRTPGEKILSDITPSTTGRGAPSTCHYCGRSFRFEFKTRHEDPDHCNYSGACSKQCLFASNRCNLRLVAFNLKNFMQQQGITPNKLAPLIGDVKNMRTGKTITPDGRWVRRRLNGEVIWSSDELGRICTAAGTTLKAMND